MKVTQKFSPFDFEPYESYIRYQCTKTFQKIYIVYHTFPGIEFTILYNGENLSAM